MTTFLEVSYFAFETKINQMVQKLLKPLTEKAMTDQAEFANINKRLDQQDEQIKLIHATVFEDGKGQRIFEVIGRQIKGLEEANEHLEEKLKFGQDQFEQRLQDVIDKEREMRIMHREAVLTAERLQEEVTQHKKEQQRDQEHAIRRSDELAKWLQRDFDKLEKQMDDVKFVSTRNDE